MIYSINEGQQAKEYKNRKYIEMLQKGADDNIRYARRYNSNYNDKDNGQYIGPGNKHTEYSKSDADRSTKAHDIREREVDRRRQDYIDKAGRTRDEEKKLDVIKKSEPRSPKSNNIVSNAIYNKRHNNYNSRLNLQQRNVDSARSDEVHSRDQYVKSMDHSVTDSINRHIRRHPKAYKESCGIFSSVVFI